MADWIGVTPSPEQGEMIAKIKGRIEQVAERMQHRCDVMVRLLNTGEVNVELMPIDSKGRDLFQTNSAIADPTERRRSYDEAMNRIHYQVLSYIMGAGMGKHPRLIQPSHDLLFKPTAAFSGLKPSFASLDALAICLNSLAKEEDVRIDVLQKPGPTRP